MLFATSLSFGLLLASVASAKVYNVQVGNKNGDTIYSPEAIFASPGDQVVFEFQQKNHSVTQSSFAAPCDPLAGGFDSGFHPVPANQTDNFPTYTITVQDTKPIWVHCQQAANTAASHCGKGMVFAVNCGPDGSPNSFANFKNAALAIGAKLQSAAGSSDAGAPSATDFTTAAYGTATIPAAPTESVVTVTVTVEASTWTTVYSSYPGSAAATPVSVSGTNHVVVVGNANGSLTYDPPFISAAPRDTVTFQFHQKNHTATQSTFDAPCVKKADGFDSGFMPVADGATDFPTYTVTVNDTNPVWVYCRQHKPDGSSHCGAGMVFAINSVESSPRNFAAFKQLAITLNGTNATGAVAAPNSQTSQSDGALSSMATNAALGLGSLLALAASLL
ncbi:hypothetical protein K474DRAFT_833541 [Panus rudis PR-1116 ss-1]|nr:hypothetical protein K474DRAFT_833541 [Panus rudis PR-1116 ss-1]